ncbi:hypothetical protein [Saccharopolyspora shandongensis]|uniref:hypothetical protein n=1 Tax=Saccharopolyspora shandongensis TaxID=418495 RepID=UPI00115FEBF8|nr:hypothetical protein [Saccharopolyspora shandongensis]
MTQLAGKDVTLLPLEMGGFVVHASLPEHAPGIAAARGSGIAAMLAPGAVADFSGYYRIGPVSTASFPQRPWPWLPGLDPFLLMAHSSQKERMCLAVGGLTHPVTDHALGSWLRALPELSTSKRPLEDPLVILTCSRGAVRQQLADLLGRLVWFPHGEMVVGAEPLDPAGRAAGVKVRVGLYCTPDGRGGRLRSAYPQGPAGDRVRWAYRSRFTSNPASWLVERSAPSGYPAPAGLRPYLVGGKRARGLCYFDRRDRQSRSSALNAPVLGSSHVAWTPNDAYQPGTPAQTDPVTGALRAAALPWHSRELGELPFGLEDVAVVAGYFAGGRFAVYDERQDVSYWETPLAFGLRLRKDLAAADGAAWGPMPSRVLLLTDFDVVPAMARRQVTRGLGGAELITVNTLSTLFLDEDAGRGVPRARIALLPATSGGTLPVWTATTSAGISTTLSPAPGHHTHGAQSADTALRRPIHTTPPAHNTATPQSWSSDAGMQTPPAQRLLEWAPKRANQRRAALADGADLADDCVPLAAEGFAVAYGRMGNRSAEAEDAAGERVIAKKDWLGLMDILQVVPEPWPDPAKVAKTLVQRPERLAVVRLARQNQHDHVILVVHGRDPDHPGQMGIWEVDFAKTPVKRRISSQPELRALMSHASAVALLDGSGLPLSLSDAAERRTPYRAALPDPGASPAATGRPAGTGGHQQSAAKHSATQTHLDLPFHNAELKEQGRNSADVHTRFLKPTEPAEEQEIDGWVRRKITPEQAEHFKRIQQAVIAKEDEHGPDYYPFFHAQDPRIRVAQDVYNRVYARHYGVEIPDDFHFLRYPGPEDNDYSQYANMAQFFEADMSQHGLIDDNIVPTKSNIISANLSLHGGLNHLGEETFFYFQDGKGQRGIDVVWFMENFLAKFGLDTSGAAEMYRAAEELTDTAEGSLFQILVPRNLADDVAYLAHPHGLPHDDELLDDLHTLGPIRYNNPTGEGDSKLPAGQERERMNDEIARNLDEVRDVWNRSIEEPSPVPDSSIIPPGAHITAEQANAVRAQLDARAEQRRQWRLKNQAMELHNRTLERFWQGAYAPTTYLDDYVAHPERLSHPDLDRQRELVERNPEHFQGQGKKSSHEMMRVANRQNFMQARILLSANYMLNPSSGIKIVRHTTMDEESAKAYDILLDRYVEKLFANRAANQQAPGGREA